MSIIACIEGKIGGQKKEDKMADKKFEGRSVIVLYDEEREELKKILTFYQKNAEEKDFTSLYAGVMGKMFDELEKNDTGFNRKELLRIRGKAELAIKNSNAPHWKRAYESLFDSCDYLDALIARHDIDMKDKFILKRDRERHIKQ